MPTNALSRPTIATIRSLAAASAAAWRAEAAFAAPGRPKSPRRAREFALLAEASRRAESAWREADEARLARRSDESRLAAVRQARALAARRATERRISATERRVSAAVGAAYALCAYRRASGRWVGGRHDLAVTVSDTDAPSAGGTTTRVWHRKHAWSGTNSEHRLCVRSDWPRRVDERGCAVVRLGGELRLVLDCDAARGTLLHALVVLPARGFDLRAEWRWVDSAPAPGTGEAGA